jgi:hemolysin activation/secretion protein
VYRSIASQIHYSPMTPIKSPRIIVLSSALAIVLALPTAPAFAQAAPRITVPDASQILVPPTPPKPVSPQSTGTGQNLNLPDTTPNVPHLRFTNVRVVGASVVHPDAIAALFAPLQGRDATAAELRAVLDKVNALYASDGYPLGRAYIPAQIMQGGTLIVRVVEGYISNVVVRADKDKTKAVVEAIAAHLVGEKPLTNKTLQRYMLLIQDIPGITVGSQFQSMDPETGATTLLITAQIKTVTATFYLDNRANLFHLPFAPYLIGQFNNLFGWGDQETATALLSPEQKNYAFYNLGFTSPVGSDGLTLGGTASWAQAVDTQTLYPYDVRSQTSQLATTAKYPLIRATDETLNADGKVYYTHAGYSLLGVTFAHDNYVAAQIGGDYVRAFSPTLGIGGNFHLTQGLAGLSDGPHTRGDTQNNFTKIQGEARLVYQPIDQLNLIFKAIGQYASGSLYASEQISFGGVQYGRGFETAEITGDSGIGFSFQPEYTIPFDWSDSGFGKGWSVTPYVFTDYAKAYNTLSSGLSNAELVSAGGGFRLGVSNLVTLTLEADKPINRVPLFQNGKDVRFYVGFEMGVTQALSLIGESP